MGGLLSMGRVTSVLFPAFLWLGACHPRRAIALPGLRCSRCCRRCAPPCSSPGGRCTDARATRGFIRELRSRVLQLAARLAEGAASPTCRGVMTRQRRVAGLILQRRECQESSVREPRRYSMDFASGSSILAWPGDGSLCSATSAGASGRRRSGAQATRVRRRRRRFGRALRRSRDGWRPGVRPIERSPSAGAGARRARRIRARPKVCSRRRHRGAGRRCRARAGLLQLYLGRRSEGAPDAAAAAPGRCAVANARDYARAARAARAPRTLRGRQRLLPRSDRAGAERCRRSTPSGASCFSRSTIAQRRREVVPGGAQGRARLRAGAARHGAGRRRRKPAGGRCATCAARSSSTRRTSARICSSPSWRSTKTRKTRRARRIAKAQAINPNSLEAYALTAAIDFVEGKDAEYKAAIAAALKTQSALRRGLPRRRRGHGALLPVRRGRRAGAARHRDRSRERARARRSRRAPDADRRRAQRAPRARNGVPRGSVRRHHLQPARAARHARQLPDHSGRRPDRSSCTPTKPA